MKLWCPHVWVLRQQEIILYCKNYPNLLIIFVGHTCNTCVSVIPTSNKTNKISGKFMGNMEHFGKLKNNFPGLKSSIRIGSFSKKFKPYHFKKHSNNDVRSYFDHISYFYFFDKLLMIILL